MVHDMGSDYHGPVMPLFGGSWLVFLVFLRSRSILLRPMVISRLGVEGLRLEKCSNIRLHGFYACFL